jgi:putative membrane protein (TIGR04086 family)
VAVTAGDRQAAGAGALAALAIAAPAAILAQAVDALSDSGWSAVFVPVVLLGFAVGGYAAAQRSSGTPLVNGALAAAAAFVVVQLVGIVRRVIADEPLRWGAYLFNALLAACVGVLGAMLASRRAG